METEQVLLITSEDNISEFPLLENSVEKNPKLQLVTERQIEVLEKDGFHFPKNIKKGDVLLQNPFAINNYVNVEDDFRILTSKMELLSEIMGYLGAQQIAFQLYQKGVKIEKRQISVKGEAKGWNYGISAKYKNDEMLEKSCLYYADGGAYSLDERKTLYERAKKLASEYPVFKNDAEVQKLFRQRNPDFPDKMGGEFYFFDVDSEINGSLDIAASLQSFDPNMFSIGIKAQQEISTKAIFSLRCAVIWNIEIAGTPVKEVCIDIAKKYKENKENTAS